MTVPLEPELAHKRHDEKEREDRNRLRVITKFIWGRRIFIKRVWYWIVAFILVLGLALIFKYSYMTT